MSACAVSSASHPYGRIVVVVVHHLGRHPARRAHEGPRTRVLHGTLDHARNAQIGQTHAPIGVDENVPRLDIATMKRDKEANRWRRLDAWRYCSP